VGDKQHLRNAPIAGGMGLAEELVEGLLDQELAALVDAVFVVGV
jgi:hypothetical protein